MVAHYCLGRQRLPDHSCSHVDCTARSTDFRFRLDFPFLPRLDWLANHTHFSDEWSLVDTSTCQLPHHDIWRRMGVYASGDEAHHDIEQQQKE